MKTVIALFTRDLRVHDNPTMRAAVSNGDRVVPLFMLDEVILGSAYNRPNRAAFLADCLEDLHRSLEALGSGLVLRQGDVVGEVLRAVDQAGAEAVYVSGDVSRRARRRETSLRQALGASGVALHVCAEAHFVVAPGCITPKDRDHMALFTPYFRRWAKVRCARSVAGLRVSPRRPCDGSR